MSREQLSLVSSCSLLRSVESLPSLLWSYGVIVPHWWGPAWPCHSSGHSCLCLGWSSSELPGFVCPLSLSLEVPVPSQHQLEVLGSLSQPVPCV